MRHPRAVLSVSLALAGLAGAARADVLVVDQNGGGDFTSLAIAAAAAQDGDVLLVHAYSNNWPVQTLVLGDKSLTIVADGGLPDVDRVRVEGLPFGKTIVLRGLKIDAGLQLVDDIGAVRVESCQAQGLSGSPGGPTWGEAADGAPGALISGCADVALSSCTLTGGPGADIFEDDTDFNTTAGGAGLELHDSKVTLTHCACSGGRGGSDYDDGNAGRSGGAGVSNSDSQLVIIGGGLLGGDGGAGGCNLFPSICGGGGDGGDGLLSLTAGASSWVRNAHVMHGGEGGQGAGGMPDGLHGRPIDLQAGSVNSWPAVAGAFSASSPVREGQPIMLHSTGLPGDVIWVLASLSPGQSIKPAYQGSLLLGPPLLVQAAVGVLPASGMLDLLPTAPALLPAAQSLDVFLQAVTFRSGAWLFGPASTLTLLDSSL